MKSLTQLFEVIDFFEERRGRLYGFRWRDRADYSSARHGGAPSPSDQQSGVGDGATTSFQLVKMYGSTFAPYQRVISKPVVESVRVAVGGVEKTSGVDFSVDAATGVVTFTPSAVPGVGDAVTAGFLFDVPARFDTDYLEIDMAAFEAGEIPKIPIVEIIP